MTNRRRDKQGRFKAKQVRRPKRGSIEDILYQTIDKFIATMERERTLRFLTTVSSKIGDFKIINSYKGDTK